MTEEIWKDIEGYENLYQVSNMGRVKSLDKLDGIGRTVKGKILSLTADKDGYLQVSLYKNGANKRCKVHRLVAQAFIPNPENKLCVDHINTIKDDNRIENLRWVTHKENCNNPLSYKKLLENIPHRYLDKNPNSKQIIQFSQNGKLIRKWRCMEEAALELNILPQGISKCCRGTRKTSGGSKWEYYNTDRYLIALMNKTIKDREKKRTA